MSGAGVSMMEGGKRKPGLEMVEAVLGGLGAELTVVDRKDEWSGIGGE